MKISFLLFSQGSCSLCILSYTAEHPNFLEHYHTQIHGFKTPRDFKKFWTFSSLLIRNNFLKKSTWQSSWSDKVHSAGISPSEVYCCVLQPERLQQLALVAALTLSCVDVVLCNVGNDGVWDEIFHTQPSAQRRADLGCADFILDPFSH